MLKQRTLKTAISTTGVGMHNGEKVTLTLRPAAADTGIVFKRVDLPQPNEILASPTAVNDTHLCSAVEVDGVRVATVEHIMSALAGLGIDNAYVEVNAAEMPIMDGSAGPFIYLLREAGIVEQAASKKFIRIKKTVEIIDGDKWVRFEPYHGFKVDFTIAFILSCVLWLANCMATIATLGLLSLPALVLAPIVIHVAMATYLMAEPRGATLGMRAAGLRVVNLDGRKLDHVQAFLMTAMYFATVTVFFPVLAVGFFADRARLLHDIVVGTIVVRADPD